MDNQKSNESVHERTPDNARMIKCESCGSLYGLSEIEVQERNCKGMNFSVMYYECPRCKKMFLIAVKDQRYYELLDDVSVIQKRILKCRDKEVNDEFAEKLAHLLRTKQDRLSEYVEKLRNKYEGKFTVLTSEETTDITYLPRSNG